MNTINDCYTLNNGMKLPCLGFGTYNEKDGDNLEIIRGAIRAGYRFFDTASIYETERVLGQAVKESGLPREEFLRSLIAGAELRAKPCEHHADLLRKVAGLCNNANQLAHVANATGQAGNASVQEMLRISKAVWKIVKEEW